MNKCNHPQCKALKPREMYACRRHWWQLPQAVRERLSIGWKKDVSMWNKAHAEAQAYWIKRPPAWSSSAPPEFFANKYGFRDGLHFVREHRLPPFDKPSHLKLVVVSGNACVEAQIDLYSAPSLWAILSSARLYKKALIQQMKEKRDAAQAGE